MATKPNTEVANCTQCGADFTRLKTKTSRKHRRKFCSSACQTIVRCAKQKAAAKFKTKTCKWCGEEYEWRYGSGQQYRGHCSADCLNSSNAKRARELFQSGHRPACRMPKKFKEPTPCEQCGEPTTRPKYCSIRCGQIANGNLVGHEPEKRNCLECGTQFEGIHPQNQYCSTDCSRRVNNRRSSAIRRARLLKRTREYFDPLDVLKRDKWRCHICGEKTPKRLRGTTDPRAPELDHITPLAAGGEHSPKNTACACRRCNLAKSDKPLGQLRLIA